MKIPAESHATAGRLSQSSSRAVTFAEFGVDLTEAALNGTLPPLIGRKHELDTVIRILGRVTKANPVLIGEPGVGKKTIVNGLARRISEAEVPLHSQDKRVVTLDLAAIASGVKSRARFEENLESILCSLQASNLVFFVDGLHALAQTQRFVGIINVLKPALRKGDIHCISTAVPAEYDKTLEAAPWLEQYFTPVQVRPLDEAEALIVLRGVKESFEKFHSVTYTDEALQYAVFHSNSYFRNQHLPEKAIDLIDEAGSLVQLSQGPLPDEVLQAQKRVKFIQDRHEAALSSHEFEKARFYSAELNEERKKLEELRGKYKVGEHWATTVTRDHIEKIVAERTGVSIESLRKSRISGGGNRP
jgi:ATP-dependent Clp protease ATP-binding subunit ClpC